MHKDDQFSKSDGQRTKLSGITGASLSYLPGDIVDNDYQLLKLLGRGGMGAVFACRHLQMDKQYALKLLSGDTLTGEAWSRFQSEAISLARLNHPGIVTVYNMGVDKGQCPYFVMDLLAGETLDAVLKHSGRLNARHALDIFIQVADALSSAHLQGIIHRDIKPSNLMLVQEGKEQRESVKIVDFGIARVPKAGTEAQSQTATGLIFGTPFYMSPEQCQGAKVDPRSDVYSFGCTLYEALSGEPPFVGDSAFHTFMMHQSNPPPPLPLDLKGQPYPEALHLALAKMLSKKPADRYQTMNQVKHDLERIKAGKPVMGQESAVTLPKLPSGQHKGIAELGGGGSDRASKRSLADQEHESAEKAVSHFPLLKVGGIGLGLVVVVAGLMSLFLRDHINFTKTKIDTENDPIGVAFDNRMKKEQEKNSKDEARKLAVQNGTSEKTNAGGKVDSKGQVQGSGNSERDGSKGAASDKEKNVASKAQDDDEPKRDPSQKHSDDMLDENISQAEKNATSELKIDAELTKRLPGASPIYPWLRMRKFGASREELLSVDITRLFMLDTYRSKCENRWRQILTSPPLVEGKFLRGTTFEFPRDVSLGMIKIDDQPRRHAMGRVPFKPGEDAFLYMHSSIRKIPDVLTKFGPDDLTGVAMVLDSRVEVNRAIDIILKWRRLKDLWFFNPILKTVAIKTDGWAESTIADDDLPRLDKFKGLRAIGLCHPVTGPAVIKRPFLRRIEALGLRRIDNCAPLLKVLPHLDNLKELFLMTLETTDNDLQPLTQMKNLRKLTVLRGFLTLGSLRYFKQMKALRELHLDRNDWSPEQKADFQKNLPLCKVSFEKVIDLETWPMNLEMTLIKPTISAEDLQ